MTAKGKTTKRSGGSLMGMRSGVRRMVGQGKKGKAKKVTFVTVLTWAVVLALLLLLVWQLRR